MREIENENELQAEFQEGEESEDKVPTPQFSSTKKMNRKIFEDC